jgi:uncharacterized cupin superfamily protein
MIKKEKANSETISQLGATRWPIWTKEISEFPWSYDQTEICLILEGEAIISQPDSNDVTIKAGDLVTFQAGLNCYWNIRKAIRKHYTFL